MFECPNCGYRLPACWKAHRYFLYAYYCRLDEFEPFYSPAATELLKAKLDLHNVSCADPLESGKFTLHLTKPRGKNPQYVLMILTEFEQLLYKRDLIEKHVARDPAQTSLIAVKEKRGQTQ